MQTAVIGVTSSKPASASRVSRTPSLLDEYLDESREHVLAQMRRTIPKSARCKTALYDRMFEYPLRGAKALRPALCLATARAFGAELEAVLPTACVLELYHNAFLIHDDVEDDSERRRNGPTLHVRYGIPIAMNVGDAMLALCLEPLLGNMELIGLGKSLRVLRVISRMARESAEGQALELDWIRAQTWAVTEMDYLRMVRKKTSHYTFIAPVEIGAVVGSADAESVAILRRFGSALGAAFQIQDDALNLTSKGKYGKDHLGDLWEGKRTLILVHALRHSTVEERSAALDALNRSRWMSDSRRGTVGDLLEKVANEACLSTELKDQVRAALGDLEPSRNASDVEFLLGLIEKYQSVGHARALAARSAKRAACCVEALRRRVRPSVHLDFLEELSAYVVERSE